MQLSAVAELLKGELFGDDASFNTVTINTRAMHDGDLYVAIKGLNFDGVDFVEAAGVNGAAGAIVEKLTETALPQVLVKDAKVALGQLAQLNRRQSGAAVVGITGSQGKTTVKEMLGQILTLAADTLVTKGNLNNEIGVPLTLLEIENTHGYGVIEMGANHAGEIGYCVKLVEPNIAVITNAARVHIEGFKSLEGVAKAKGEIIDGVPISGTVVLNADDQYFEKWKKRAGQRKVVCFSLRRLDVEYFATEIRTSPSAKVNFKLKAKKENRQVKLQLLGKHNVNNAIAAAAVAMEVGATFDQVITGLSKVKPVKGRLCPRRGINQGSLIDDSYNASPGSFQAAIDVLAEFEGTKILVMGDMAELGDESVTAHEELGKYASNAGIDQLLGVGEYTAHSAVSFGAGASHYDSKNELIEKCISAMSSDTTVLIKGSRSAGMNEVVEALTVS